MSYLYAWLYTKCVPGTWRVQRECRTPWDWSYRQIAVSCHAGAKNEPGFSGRAASTLIAETISPDPVCLFFVCLHRVSRYSFVYPSTHYVDQTCLELVRFPCLCLLSSGIKGVHHHSRHLIFIFILCVWVFVCMYVCTSVSFLFT